MLKTTKIVRGFTEVCDYSYVVEMSNTQRENIAQALSYFIDELPNISKRDGFNEILEEFKREDLRIKDKSATAWQAYEDRCRKNRIRPTHQII